MTSNLGLRWCLDSSFFPIARSRARVDLWRLYKRGVIELGRSDVLLTEWQSAPDEVRKLLEEEASALPEYLGPFVPGHSRARSSVVGSPRDEDLLREVVAVLIERRAGRAVARNDFRDAMHYAWAVRYAFDGLISSDAALLRRGGALLDRFGVRVLTPEAALSVSQRLLARAIFRERAARGDMT